MCPCNWSSGNKKKKTVKCQLKSYKMEVESVTFSKKKKKEKLTEKISKLQKNLLFISEIFVGFVFLWDISVLLCVSYSLMSVIS